MRDEREDDKQDTALPVDAVGERVLAIIGQRRATAHSSSVASEEEVQRGSGAVADMASHWDPLCSIRTGQ
jgi:hypothetical protein